MCVVPRMARRGHCEQSDAGVGNQIQVLSRVALALSHVPVSPSHMLSSYFKFVVTSRSSRGLQRRSRINSVRHRTSRMNSILEMLCMTKTQHSL